MNPMSEEVATDSRRCLNGVRLTTNKSWQEGAKFLLETDLGKALVKAMMIEMVRASKRRN